MLRGGIDWSLQFHWIEVHSKSRSSPSSDFTMPIKSPIQSGAVFAVRRDFFSWLGKYDSSIGATGVEDIDLSLRAWLCGGQVDIVPCSRVGLIQTSRKQLGVQRVPFSTYLMGAKKVAELWLDEYKRFFYAVRPSARMQPLSNLTSSRRLREKNKCGGFKWFLSSVYPQLLPLVSDEIGFGTISQQENCVDLVPGQMPLIAKVRECKDGKDSQEWSWRKKGMIVSNGMCLTSDLDTMHGFVVVQFCKDPSSQGWYRNGLKIVHQQSNFCLDSKRGDVGLIIAECVENSPTQTWYISSEVAGPPNPEHDFTFAEEKAQL
ncbi:polypeptide N-acetylgalactosaminyltransferase [Elysia marginata]|uniref:Polypeptide N-acetylgalactosaminyltransferase n=1 Tax=Elysia marginata TaxID=1093978 RepID=A0AAV4FXJ8_9GAST|nr:polypeptide N-acetylgalactosaminyltransferase [Elysia marginata]